jgi:prolyl-tRNA synthetase
MRYSKLFGKTRREDPHEVRWPSYSLLYKGGFVRQMGQGLFSILPLGMRVIKNLEAIISEEMDKLGGQEMYASLITPADIWRKSGRYDWMGGELIRFQDRHRRELVISPTHEEAYVELVRSSLSSYRDLPILLYQFQIKFRDEEKARFGLARTKEIYMYDGYSFHRSHNELNNFFPRMFAAFSRIFDRCYIQTRAAEAAVGFIGGEKSYEFLMPSRRGAHEIIVCEQCRYCASRDIAVGGKEYLSGEPLALEKAATPGCTGMDDLARFLELPLTRLAKTLVYSTPAGLVMAVVRGDYEVAEEKLAKYLGCPLLRKAADEALLEAGLIPGYLSPVGQDERFRIVVDDSVARSSNLVLGANEEGYHYLNANFGRDFSSREVADISLTRQEKTCLLCGGRLSAIKAIELGHIFKLGDYYSRSMNLQFQEERGKPAFPHMGCYGIGLGRLMDAVVQANHDQEGIVWPPHIAPYKAFLMSIGKSLGVKKAAELLHEELGDAALYDDRDESPGVKFKDADLLGLPVRLVVSGKHLGEGRIELRERRSGKITLVDKNRVLDAVKDMTREAK